MMHCSRAPDEMLIIISIIPCSSPNPMFDHLLESSHRDDSNKWSNIGFCEEIRQIVLLEANLILPSVVVNIDKIDKSNK